MRRFQLLLILLVTLAATASPAERPTAMRLFPARTAIFVRTPEARQFIDTLTESEFFTDPEIAPFLQSLFGKIDASYRERPGQVTGGGLGELLQLFQGEVALGIVPRRNESPGVIALADTVSQLAGDRNDPTDPTSGPQRAADLVASIVTFAEENGSQVSEETIGSTTATVLRPNNNARRAWGMAQRDGVLLMSNDRILLESALLKWDEAEGVPAIVPVESAASINENEAADESDEASEDEDQQKRIRRLRQRYKDSLADNAAFTESLRECVDERIGGGDNSPPNGTVFIDPLGLFRAAADGNVGMRFALATLPVLGLDGVEGVAGAIWFDAGDWDTLIRGQLLLDNPRAGVLKMARLDPTDLTPGDTIPADVSNYTCGALNFTNILDGAEQLYDKIRGDGKFAELAEENVTNKIGFAPAELVAHLEGRIVSIQGYGDYDSGEAVRVTPARAVLLRIDDSEAVDTTVRAILEKTGVPVVWEEHAGVPYLCTKEAAEANPSVDFEADNEQVRVQRRGNLACAAIIGEDLVLTETIQLLKKLIETHQGNRPRLASHLPFRLTASRANRLGAATVGGEEGRVLIYDNPGEQFRQWHAAGESSANREQLDRLAEMAPPMRWLRDALDESGVPPIDAMLKYAVPSGAAIYDTPRGFRYVQFSFKTEETE